MIPSTSNGIAAPLLAEMKNMRKAGDPGGIKTSAKIVAAHTEMAIKRKARSAADRQPQSAPENGGLKRDYLTTITEILAWRTMAAALDPSR